MLKFLNEQIFMKNTFVLVAATFYLELLQAVSNSDMLLKLLVLINFCRSIKFDLFDQNVINERFLIFLENISQLAITCSKLTIENTRARREICSK